MLCPCPRLFPRSFSLVLLFLGSHIYIALPHLQLPGKWWGNHRHSTFAAKFGNKTLLHQSNTQEHSSKPPAGASSLLHVCKEKESSYYLIIWKQRVLMLYSSCSEITNLRHCSFPKKLNAENSELFKECQTTFVWISKFLWQHIFYVLLQFILFPTHQYLSAVHLSKWRIVALKANAFFFDPEKLSSP